MTAARHQYRGPEQLHDEEVPMNPCMALAHALAAGRQASLGPTRDDFADAAFALVDMREGGWDVQPGLTGEAPGGRASILAIMLAKGRGRNEPSPVEKANAERAVRELRNMAFDMVRLDRNGGADGPVVSG